MQLFIDLFNKYQRTFEVEEVQRNDNVIENL